METTLTELHRRLLGNGQPGELDKLDMRLTKLENWKFWVVGIAVGIGVAAGGIGHKILETMIP